MPEHGPGKEGNTKRNEPLGAHLNYAAAQQIASAEIVPNPVIIVAGVRAGHLRTEVEGESAPRI